MIQSDFVTQANREDIVTTSRRNTSLLSAIANAFATSVRDLCEHPTLRYQWMRYLPELEEYPWDPFWKGLVEKIKNSICDRDLIFLRGLPSPVKLGQARRLSPRTVDRCGNPLLNDLPFSRALYVSNSYEECDLETLCRFGLQNLHHHEFIIRVKMDLSREDSKMRSPDTEDDWHSKVTWILDLSFEKNWSVRQLETRLLELIPLRNGKWVNSLNDNLVFPETERGIPIPIDLGLQLVSPRAFRVDGRTKLFKHLGVKFPSNQEIRTKILQQYQSPGFGPCFEHSLGHLR